ncbi:MAG TPA: hypothetical protein VMF66_00210 [Candidatus Acidoferrum sp.]|nr:hypothetical protein [Candidatus Acidoferrum sp.]
MRGKLAFAGFVLALSASVAVAQEQSPNMVQNDLYCSGIVTSQSVPRNSYVITGQGSDHNITWSDGDYVYIDRGASQGVKVGDEFSVVRPEVDEVPDVQWTKWQDGILSKMGTVWADEGRVTAVVVQPNVSIAQVSHSCNYLQRGDIILPFAERTAPPLKSEANFDQFAPPSGKAKAMIIMGKNFQEQLGTYDVAYVNLGTSQGVHVGDYFRVFRYTGTQHEFVFQEPQFAFDVAGDWGPTFGFGAAPRKWDWSNTPREVLGEGVVLRTSPNSSTVMLTLTLKEVYSGDYVEIE